MNWKSGAGETLNIFVIMPFDSEFDSVYRELIQKPLEERKHVVRRADDVATHQNILKAIVQNIYNADLIIADLTTQNPNVFYELGIAHALLRPTIQIVKNIEDVPFDLRTYTVLTYSEHFTVASKLQDELLGYIEREDDDEYNFSNPVSETLGGEVKIIRSYQLSAEPDEAKALSIRLSESLDLVQDVADDEDDEMGMLDAIVAAEESTVEVSEVAIEIAAQFTILSEKAQAHTDKINRLNANPDQKGLNSRRLQVMREFAKDVDYFSNQISPTIPRLRESWETTEQGLDRWISASSIKNQEELNAIESLMQTIDTVYNGLGENRTVFQSFRDSQNGLRGLSKATDRALTSSNRVLQKLDGEIALGESVLRRIMELLKDMMARYTDASGDDDFLE